MTLESRTDGEDNRRAGVRVAAGGIHQVVARLGANLPDVVLESVSSAFRELLLNALEWGGQLDPIRQVRISCVRTNRMLI